MKAVHCDACRQRIKLKVLMMPKDYMNHMLLKELLKTKQLELIKMDDQDSL